jgi:hypothetical protein
MRSEKGVGREDDRQTAADTPSLNKREMENIMKMTCIVCVLALVCGV